MNLPEADHSHDNELLTLANLACEQQLDDAGRERLEALLRSDERLRALYVEFIQLHGQLLWDAAVMPGAAMADRSDITRGQQWEGEAPAEPHTVTPAIARSPRDSDARTLDSRLRGNDDAVKQRRWQRVAATVAALAVCALLAFWLVPNTDVPAPIAHTDETQPTELEGAHDRDSSPVIADSGDLPPLNLNGMNRVEALQPQGASPRVATQFDAATSNAATSPLSDATVIAGINDLLSTAWRDHAISPAEPATDHEWLRRVYLTTTGRIPTIDEVESFIESDEPSKRSELLASLVADPRTAENQAAIWTNLLIGRSNARGVDQDALFEFLQTEFESNAPWMDTVGRLIAAEGRSDENGATNFLLAHLNDQATPATAVTARLFLGRQVQCTQCHDHPFTKERTQDEFWSLNAFFKQTERQTIKLASAEPMTTGLVMSLSDSADGGMTFYDTIRGQQKAVLPEFAGTALPADGQTPRRAELARLLASDAEHQVARAMVNRMWAQFFGYGFTNPVDDLGPHNPPSHPELLDHLTQSFVQSNYDLRRLMTWIITSDAWQLSGRGDEALLAADDPEEGGVPLFARSYPRPLGPEQVYESIRTAIRSASSQPLESSAGTEHRRQWVDQFVRAYGTDENDEQLTFEGNIAQALLLMNGEDLEQAIPLASAAITAGDRSGRATPDEALQRLSLATLNRAPTEAEERVFRSRLRNLARNEATDTALRIATEDMLWAYLNSSEFVSLN